MNAAAEREAVVLQADEQMLKYGYAQPSELGELLNEESDTFKKDIRAYQNFAGIEETGKLDEQTIDQMHKKRCGDQDIEKRSRFRRYVAQGTKWKNGLNMKLRWKLVNHGEDLPRDTVLEVMRKAFKLWSTVTNLKFIETTDDNPVPEILVSFGKGYHGDRYAFDGRGGTLAHAFYPLNNRDLAGDCHFDDAEKYSAFRKPGHDEIDLLWVAVHEIGHSIGLAHSRVRNSIMFPYYPRYGWTDNLQLRNDDIEGIQYIYGKKGEQPKVPVPINGGWKVLRTTSCSKTCGGGTRYQLRSCTNPPPQHNGMPCDGPTRLSFTCNTQACPVSKPVDGGWKVFHTSKCSRTCGGGTQYQLRSCNNPRPQNGGKKCAGDFKITKTCNTQACPPKPCKNNSGDDICKTWNFCETEPRSYWERYCNKFCGGC